jgi:menaquinone-dependent protoporphyrinogen oxidase
MAKVLIVYGSGYGQTQKVAEFIAKQLRERGKEVDVVFGKRLPRKLSPETYDAIIVAASVRMMKFQKYIVSFVRKYSQQLQKLPSAFVSVSMAEAQSDSERGGFQPEWLENFSKESGWSPAIFRSFAGALDYRKYNFFTRRVMKKIAEKTGMNTDTSANHEYTDWDAVRKFADEFADMIS